VIVVTDTSVVLNLCCLHLENLLSDLFGTVLAPPTVAQELKRLASVDIRFRSLTFPAFIQITAPMKIPSTLAGNQKLHAGEIDALSLAVGKKADAVLMDKRAGRDAAADLGLRCIGILGVLIQAKTIGLLTQIRPLLDQLE
jgi:predicted nucleic acid-binding protein